MARQTVVNNARGSAIVEAAPVLGFLVTLVMVLLSIGYFVFARTWVSYQADQALFCAAEAKPPFHCENRLREKVISVLPWGNVEALNIRHARNNWRLETIWSLKGYKIRINRELSLKDMIMRKALR